MYMRIFLDPCKPVSIPGKPVTTAVEHAVATAVEQAVATAVEDPVATVEEPVATATMDHVWPEIYDVISDGEDDLPHALCQGRVIVAEAGAAESSLRCSTSEVELDPKEDSQVAVPKGSCGNYGEQHEQPGELTVVSDSEDEVAPAQPDPPAEAPWPGQPAEQPFRRAGTSCSSLGQDPAVTVARSLVFDSQASEASMRGGSTVSLEEKMGAMTLGDDDEGKVGSVHNVVYASMLQMTCPVYSMLHMCAALLRAGKSAITC